MSMSVRTMIVRNGPGWVFFFGDTLRCENKSRRASGVPTWVGRNSISRYHTLATVLIQACAGAVHRSRHFVSLQSLNSRAVRPRIWWSFAPRVVDLLEGSNRVRFTSFSCFPSNIFGISACIHSYPYAGHFGVNHSVSSCYQCHSQ